MTIKEMFIETVSKALISAEMIPDAAQKAEAYASIASALARTGMVRGSDETTAAPVNKEALKNETTKGKKEHKETPKAKEVAKEKETPKVKEEVIIEEEKVYEEVKDEDKEIENCNDVIQEGAEDVQEWTDELQAELANEIQFVSQASDYLEDEINECVSLFTNGIANDISFINPANIKGFVVYLECYIKERDGE